MAIEPAFTAESFQDEEQLPFEGTEYVDLPDGDEIEIEIEEDGGDVDMEAMEAAAEDVERDVPFDSNLAEAMSETELNVLSKDLITSIDIDIVSRKDWEEALKSGLRFLGPGYEERTEPFRGSSGVIHPLIAESIVQFQAHAYSETFPASGPARTQLIGTSTPEEIQRAERVKNHLNYEITEDIEDYEEEQDDLLFNLPLDGSAFKKVYWDPELNRPSAKYVRAEDIIVPYTAKAVETCHRVTHRTPMSTGGIKSAVLSGFYLDLDLSEPSVEKTTPMGEAREEATGVQSSIERDEYTLYEVHVLLDLVGFEDTDGGVPKNYIVTIEQESGKILSIYRNWKEEDPLQRKIQYFVGYKFLPGLGFYGFGLTHMIGNLGRAATGILRQLIDAGTFANLPGGFKAKGLKTPDQDESIKPGEWRDIDVPGGNIRDSIIPLPYKEPSATLFQLLGYLVESGQRFHSVNLEKVADSNQQAPVGTTMALLEHGMRVMGAIFKRLHRSQKKELRILTRVIKENQTEYPYDIEGFDRKVLVEDFSAKIDVLPVSDPNIFSTTQRISMAQTELQMVTSDPELHGKKGKHEAYRRMYASIGVHDISSILPPLQEPKPVDAAYETSEVLTGEPMKAFKGQDHDSHVDSHISSMSLPSMINPVIIMAIESHILEHFSIKAVELAEEKFAEDIQKLQMLSPELQEGAKSDFEKAVRDEADAIVKTLIEGYSKMRQESAGQEEDPQKQLVRIREQEIALQAQRMQLEAKNKDDKLNLDRDRLSSSEKLGFGRIQQGDRSMQSREQIAEDNRESQEQIADDRNLTSLESSHIRADSFNKGGE